MLKYILLPLVITTLTSCINTYYFSCLHYYSYKQCIERERNNKLIKCNKINKLEDAQGLCNELIK